MHRWHFQRLFRWLIPAFVLAVSLCAAVIEQKAAGVGLAFADDSAYASLAVGRTIAVKQSYGLPSGERVPATRDSLWRVAVAAVGGMTGNYQGAAYLLGSLCSLITLLMSLRLTRLLFPFPPFMVYSAVLLIVAPGFLTEAISGTSAPMATMLVTGACLLHMRGLWEKHVPLPPSAALLVGLLMWIRIEFLLLWVVFVIHAVILGHGRDSQESPVLLATMRGVSGFLILALSLLPLLAWNLYVIQVPWPQAMGAPFTMDAWGGGVVRRYLAMAFGSMPAAFSHLHGTPFVSGILERVFVWYGAIFIMGLSLTRTEERPYTLVLFLLVLLPVVYAFLYPYLGWGGARVVFQSIQPICIIAAGFGIFRTPFLLESLYRKWKEGLPEAPGFGAWWIVMGSLLLIVGLARNGSQMSRRIQVLSDKAAARRTIAEKAADGEIPRRRCLTDEAGWASYHLRCPVIDLTGELTPEVLACLDQRGRLDSRKLESYLAVRKPDSLVLWNRGNDFVQSLVACEAIDLAAPRSREQTWPKACVISWPGAF